MIIQLQSLIVTREQNFTKFIKMLGCCKIKALMQVDVIHAVKIIIAICMNRTHILHHFPTSAAAVYLHCCSDYDIIVHVWSDHCSFACMYDHCCNY